MVFNSFGFLFAFLPIALLGYRLCSRWWGDGGGTIFLVAASMVFYGWKYPQCLPILIGSVLVNGLLSKVRKSHWGVTIGVILNVGVLFFFKFGKLLWGVDAAVLDAPGISFFTFSQIAFLVENYRGTIGKMGWADYSLYITFFPKLMQGPIMQPGDFHKKEKTAGTDLWEMRLRNLILFTFGLFKKVLLADTLGKAVNVGYLHIPELNFWDAGIVMLSYTLQLYFDFSGYCDMAMGIAGFFGYELPVNFDSPYKAVNIMDFWKRWHRTLTGFLTKYIYIPLGGNRKGKSRMYVNFLIVFLISGIWHGAGWQFLVWGMMHGVLYVLTRAFSERRSGKKKKDGRLLHGIKVLLTFLYVNVAWVFFRAPSVLDALAFLKRFFVGGFGKVNWELAGAFCLDEFWYMIKVLGVDQWSYAHYILMVLFLLLMLVLIWGCPNSVTIAQRAKPGVLLVLATALLFVWSVVSFSEVGTFLYFNF